MTTRSELRAQRQKEDKDDVVKEPVTPVKHQHHFFMRLWGIIWLTLLLLTLLINTTLLNAGFVKKEITNSSLESVMLSQVNSSLTQYGISTSVLKKSDTDKLITQAVDQVYAGEKINLDLSSVVNNVNSSVNSQLAQYGLSTSMLPAGSSDAIAGNINTMVNSQLNTPEVSQLISGIKIARIVVNLMLVLSAVMLVIILLKSLWQHHFLASFAWVFILTAIIYTGILTLIHTVAVQLGAQQADLSPFISQVADDFQQRGFNYTITLVVLGTILLAIKVGKRIWQPRR